jgi:hypothetical protein
MIRTGIRNIGINEDVSIHDDANGDSVGVIEDGGKSKLLRIINDRKILEFYLVITEGRFYARMVLQA